MGDGVAKMLELPLLWAALEPRDNYSSELIPDKLRQRIPYVYTAAGVLSSVNPVERVGYHVSGERAELHLIEPRDVSLSVPDTEFPNGTTANYAGREFAALYFFFTLKRSIGDFMNEVDCVLHSNERHLDRISTILQRIELCDGGHTAQCTEAACVIYKRQVLYVLLAG